MEQVKRQKNSKGGRPKKIIKRDQQITVVCTLLERKTIEYKAKSIGLSYSEYLRQIGLTGKIDSCIYRLKSVPDTG